MTSGQIFHFKAKVFSLEDFILCRICGSSWRFAFRPSPPNPTIYYFTCMFASPTSTSVILLGSICYPGGETASYPATRSCWVKLLLRTQLVGARSNPYRKATETLRMKFSSNFEETGFEFCLEPWLGDWKNCVHLFSECREYLTVSLASVSNKYSCFLRLWCTSTLEFCAKHYHPFRNNIVVKKHFTLLWHALHAILKKREVTAFLNLLVSVENNLWKSSQREKLLVDIQSP